MSPDIAFKVSSLETMKNLIEDSQNLREESHFDSLVQCVASVVQ